jgi:hypothetical protein
MADDPAAQAGVGPGSSLSSARKPEGADLSKGLGE